LNHIRTLLTLLLTNSEARKLISDSSIVGRDLLARGAAKAASGLAPSDEKLRGVDAGVGVTDQTFVPKEQLDDEINRAKANLQRSKEKGTEVLEANRPGLEANAEQAVQDRTGVRPDIDEATGTASHERQITEVTEDEAVLDADGNLKKPTSGFLGKLRVRRFSFL